jgi:hypothetical protein
MRVVVSEILFICDPVKRNESLVSGQALLLGLPHQQVQAGREFMRATTLKDTFDKGFATG